MTLPTWPSSISHLIQRDTWSFKPARAFRRTEMEGGARQRRFTMSAPITASGTVWMSEREFEFFKGFYDDVLKDGASWFTMPFYVGEGGYRSNEVRFTDAYSVTVAAFGELSIQMPLELRKLPYVDASTLWFLEQYSEAFAVELTDALQPIVNLDSGLPGYPYVTRNT